jgi:hypothetical protein
MSILYSKGDSINFQKNTLYVKFLSPNANISCCRNNCCSGKSEYGKLIVRQDMIGWSEDVFTKYRYGFCSDDRTQDESLSYWNNLVFVDREATKGTFYPLQKPLKPVRHFVMTPDEGIAGEKTKYMVLTGKEGQITQLIPFCDIGSNIVYLPAYIFAAVQCHPDIEVKLIPGSTTGPLGFQAQGTTVLTNNSRMAWIRIRILGGSCLRYSKDMGVVINFNAAITDNAIVEKRNILNFTKDTQSPNIIFNKETVLFFILKRDVLTTQNVIQTTTNGTTTLGLENIQSINDPEMDENYIKFTTTGFQRFVTDYNVSSAKNPYIVNCQELKTCDGVSFPLTVPNCRPSCCDIKPLECIECTDDTMQLTPLEVMALRRLIQSSGSLTEFQQICEVVRNTSIYQCFQTYLIQTNQVTFMIACNDLYKDMDSTLYFELTLLDANLDTRGITTKCNIRKVCDSLTVSADEASLIDIEEYKTWRKLTMGGLQCNSCYALKFRQTVGEKVIKEANCSFKTGHFATPNITSIASTTNSLKVKFNFPCIQTCCYDLPDSPKVWADLVSADNNTIIKRLGCATAVRTNGVYCGTWNESLTTGTHYIRLYIANDKDVHPYAFYYTNEDSCLADITDSVYNLNDNTLIIPKSDCDKSECKSCGSGVDTTDSICDDAQYQSNNPFASNYSMTHSFTVG